MRRIAFYMGMAAALVASCSVREENFQAPGLDDLMFHASFEQPVEAGTKVYVDENLLLRWTADDRVSIFQKETANREYRFTGQTGADTGEFQQVGEKPAGDAISHVVAVYPYQEATAITRSEVLDIVLPARQAYAANSFGLGANTMVSVSTDEALQFKNVGGYLRISLYGEGVSVSSLTLKGNKGEKIAGKASVTMPLGGVPSVSMASDATASITLTCAEPVALGATAAESVDFWFVVPPVEFEEGFTVSIQHQGGMSVKTTSKDITINRNVLSKMSPVEVKLLDTRTYRITHMWVWGGTGPEYKSTKVIDILAHPEYFNKEDGRGIDALKDNYYQLRADGTFVNYAGKDGRNWWFVYSGSKNPMDGKDVDVRQFYDVLPLSVGQYAISGSTVTFTKPDNTTTSATFVGPGTYSTSDPSKSVTIETQALKFTITGGKDVWTDPPIYTDYHAITGHPRTLYIEMEQLPDGFIVPEESRTTDADFKFIPPEDPDPGDYDWTTLPGKWNVYGDYGEGVKPRYGLWVLGGSGTTPSFVSPRDKTWDWDNSIYWESDNELIISLGDYDDTHATGTTNWWAGNDGKFWNYIWKYKNADKPEYEPYYETNLSQYYDQIPKGNKEFTLDFATMTVTLGNGHQAKFLTPGTHEFEGTKEYYFKKTLEVPEGCFALCFHLMDPVPLNASFKEKDIDRFMFAPLEYVIIFEKVE